MATERQIEANRRNAARSSGPKTAEGRARSRKNSTKHGMAGVSSMVEPGHSPEFEERRARWLAEQQPVGEAAHFALDRAVAATFRIQQCERSIERIVTSEKVRASLIWDQDRAVEAASLAARMSKEPILVVRKLETTRAGAELLQESWLGLFSILQGGRNWSESEAAKALDLLGVPPDLRECRTLIDTVEGGDPIAFRLQLAVKELNRLEEMLDRALIPLDEMDRENAMSGDLAMLGKAAKLVLRYERDAWRHYDESMKQVQQSRPEEASPLAAEVTETPEIREEEEFEPGDLSEEERRKLMEEAMPIVAMFLEQRKASGQGVTFEGDPSDEWMDAMEARMDAQDRAMALRNGTNPIRSGFDRAIEA